MFVKKTETAIRGGLMFLGSSLKLFESGIVVAALIGYDARWDVSTSR